MSSTGTQLHSRHQEPVITVPTSLSKWTNAGDACATFLRRHPGEIGEATTTQDQFHPHRRDDGLILPAAIFHRRRCVTRCSALLFFFFFERKTPRRFHSDFHLWLLKSRRSAAAIGSRVKTHAHRWWFRNSHPMRTDGFAAEADDSEGFTATPITTATAMLSSPAMV